MTRHEHRLLLVTSVLPTILEKAYDYQGFHASDFKFAIDSAIFIADKVLEKLGDPTIELRPK